MEAEEAQAHRYTGGGYAWRMTTAGAVTVANHPVLENNQEYVILHVRHEAVNDYTQHSAKLPYRNSFALLPKKIPYRAPRGTPKPVIHGTQSAIVVGPKGEEIYTNGSAVKVHFPWDRRGKKDGSDSMCVYRNRGRATAGRGRDSADQAGSAGGVQPGDPDNPVIVGRIQWRTGQSVSRCGRSDDGDQESDAQGAGVERDPHDRHERHAGILHARAEGHEHRRREQRDPQGAGADAHQLVATGKRSRFRRAT